MMNSRTLSLTISCAIGIILAVHLLSSNAQAASIDTGVSITEPTYNQVIYSSTVLIKGTSFNSTSILLGIDQSPNISISFNKDGTWSYQTSISNGEHSIIVSSSDANGNLSYDSTKFNSISSQQTPTRYNILAIEYSEGCQLMLKWQMNTTCPTLDKMIKYDNTNQALSGKFIIINGVTIRTNPETSNHYLYYSNMTVCVVCSVDLAKSDLFKTIFIEPSSFTYINKAENATKNTYMTYSNRYVSPDCITSTIGYTDKMLSDTISYMLSNCTKTFIQTNQTNTIKVTPFSYNNPFSSLHYDFKTLNLNKHSTPNCITKKCVTPIDNYKKKAWG